MGQVSQQASKAVLTGEPKRVRYRAIYWGGSSAERTNMGGSSPGPPEGTREAALAAGEGSPDWICAVDRGTNCELARLLWGLLLLFSDHLCTSHWLHSVRSQRTGKLG